MLFKERIWLGLRRLKMLLCFPYNPFTWLERVCAISEYREAARSEHTPIIWLIALWSAFRITGTERHSILPIYGLFLVPMMPERAAHCKVCFSDDNIFDKVIRILKYSLSERCQVIICFSWCEVHHECSLSLQLSSSKSTSFFFFFLAPASNVKEDEQSTWVNFRSWINWEVLLRLISKFYHFKSVLCF